MVYDSGDKKIVFKYYEALEFAIIAVVLLVFFSLVIPFLFYGIFEGSPIWSNHDDFLFLTNALGYYDPIVHAILLVSILLAASVVGALLFSFLWRKYISPTMVHEALVEEIDNALIRIGLIFVLFGATIFALNVSLEYTSLSLGNFR